MRIEEAPLPGQVIEKLESLGYTQLYPTQEEAIKLGVLEGRNLVMACPTASGKTLVAQLCALQHVLEHGGKVLYLTPLRALTWEKYQEFKQFEDLRKPSGEHLRVGVSSGDLDDRSPWLESYDIVIATNEKCDSLLRHNSPWIRNVSLVVADEIHLIGSDRGPTLEVSLSRLRQLNPKVQLLALSATIRNADEIAGWLDAETLCSTWRPVELREGVALKDRVWFKDGELSELQELHKIPLVNLTLNFLSNEGQVLVFLESRRRAESAAKMMATALRRVVDRRLLPKLQQKSLEISVTGEKTRLTDTLANAVAQGAAFHHAGLSASHRRIVEQAFKEGLLKVIVATPTLASGVNLPARTVIIGNYRRFMPGYGMQPIKVLEYKQMCGRAGRPQFDEVGYAITLASSQEEMEYLMESYLLAEPERIDSTLSREASLRSHTLAAVASRYVTDEHGLHDFFRSTFYGYNYPLSGIRLTLEGILRFLAREGLIEEDGGRLRPTTLGSRVSELYIDPYSAIIIRDGLVRGARRITDFTWLHLVCNTPDMRPLFRPRRSDYQLVEDYLETHRDELAAPLEEELDYIDYEEALSTVKTAMVLEEWINETPENELLEKYNVQPGDRYSLVTNSEWLLYAGQELARILGHKEHAQHLSELRERVKHGVSKRLLPLVRLKGIGRVRAKILYDSGLTTLAQLKAVELSKLVSIPYIGPGIAKSIKEQVGGVVDLEEWRKLDQVKVAQSSIADFIEEEFEE